MLLRVLSIRFEFVLILYLFVCYFFFFFCRDNISFNDLRCIRREILSNGDIFVRKYESFIPRLSN